MYLFKKYKVWLVGLLSLVLLFSSGTLVGAQKLEESTLIKVLDRGVLRVGILGDFEPWSFFDENYERIGFDIDVAKLMAEALDVKVEFVETGTAGRIPYLVTGKIDIVIAGFGATPERAKSVAYSKPYVAGNPHMLVAPKDSDIKSYKDLAGKKVAVSRGTSSDREITALAPEGTEILRFEEVIDCFLALEMGKADAVADGGYLYDQERIEKHPEWEMKGEIGRGIAFLAVRLEDQIWLNWINLFLADLARKGMHRKLVEKWFGSFPYALQPTYQ